MRRRGTGVVFVGQSARVTGRDFDPIFWCVQVLAPLPAHLEELLQQFPLQFDHAATGSSVSPTLEEYLRERGNGVAAGAAADAEAVEAVAAAADAEAAEAAAAAAAAVQVAEEMEALEEAEEARRKAAERKAAEEAEEAAIAASIEDERQRQAEYKLLSDFHYVEVRTIIQEHGLKFKHEGRAGTAAECTLDDDTHEQHDRIMSHNFATYV